nr:hypothetical protein DBT41_14375 [Aerococcus urinae]
MKKQGKEPAWKRGATPDEAAEIARIEERIDDLHKRRAQLTNRIAGRVRYRERHARASRLINQSIFAE